MCLKRVTRWSDDRSKIKEENGWFRILCSDLRVNLAKQQEKNDLIFATQRWSNLWWPMWTRASRVSAVRPGNFPFSSHKQELMIKNINRKKVKYKRRREQWNRYFNLSKLLVGKLEIKSKKKEKNLERTEASPIKKACAALYPCLWWWFTSSTSAIRYHYSIKYGCASKPILCRLKKTHR